MAGRSKWSNIKHRKAGQDAKRAKVFTKIIRELTVAAQDGGGNIEDNPSLRTVVEKAKSAQMPKDTMERAIARGAGGQDGADLVALTYGYGRSRVLVETSPTIGIEQSLKYDTSFQSLEAISEPMDRWLTCLISAIKIAPGRGL